MIRNLTKKTTVSEKEKTAFNFIDKIFGMILGRNQEGLIIKTRFGIHTFFMKRKIDLIVLDKKGIVKIAKTIHPNKIFIWNPLFSKEVELPPGTIIKSKTQVGDKLEIYDKISG